MEKPSFLNNIKGNLTNVASKTGIYDANKSKINQLLDEKAKMHEFIGMEIYSLYSAGSLNIAEIEPFCNKITVLSAEIAALEAESRPDADSICPCGTKLSKESRFCPSCGTKVEAPIAEASQAMTTCDCGASLPENAKFCPSCGSKAGETVSKCVCGAEITPGSQMCMECGRTSA